MLIVWRCRCRKELKEKYSSQGKAKIDSDYQRTKVDFYRMELHKLGDVHPMNRGNMTAAYFAYLQNTPGSRKAVKECVKKIVKEDKNEEEEEESETKEENSNSEEAVEKKEEETREEQAVED